jgi:hypothetical protein
MKKKEEIEQLAEKYYPPYPDGTITDEIRVLREGFIKGYSCQEDMADKKYTEEDMIDAIIYGSSLTTSNVKLYAHNYIKSLNKQDNDK